jgi:hypothetical protein
MDVFNRLTPFRMLSTTALAAALCLCFAGTAAAGPVATCPDTGVSQTTTDLTTDGSQTTIDQAIFTAFDSSGSVGSGVFPAFVVMQGNDCIQGYNTQGTEEFDTVNNSSEIVRLDTLMVVNVGGTDYVEFRLDINQNKNNSGPSGPSLDNVQIFVSNTDNLTGWQPDCTLGGVSCIYNMDAGQNRALLLDYALNNGGGNGFDLSLLLPVSRFGAALANPSGNYVYLYSSFGAVGGIYAENDGPEEWQYRTCSTETACVTPRDPPPTIPEPASVVLVGLGLLALRTIRRRMV